MLAKRRKQDELKISKQNVSKLLTSSDCCVILLRTKIVIKAKPMTQIDIFSKFAIYEYSLS